MWQVRERTGAHVAGKGEDRSTCGRLGIPIKWK